MLKIVICDDSPEELTHLESLIKEYQTIHGLSIELMAFPNGFLFLEGIQKKQHYDLCFLDIYMPGLTGIDTARELRQRNKEMKIVFTTSSRDFAIEGYKVQAADYLLKPVEKKVLFHTMDVILSGIEEKKEESLCLNTLEGVELLPFSRISLVEAYKNQSMVRLCDKRQITSTMTFGSLCQQLLAKENFFLMSRSILVNFDQVIGTKNGLLLMETGEELTIPRRKKGEITTAFLNYVSKS